MATSPNNIAFVLISGSFSQPAVYDRVISLLTSPPYSVPESAFCRVPLLSTDSSRAEGPATMDDDASAIASSITALVNQGKEVVLVMSSYGGFPGSEAAHGLSKEFRARNGLTGGIISLVYIASFIPQAGESLKALTGGMPGEEEYMSIDYTPEMAMAVFNDLESPEEQKQHFETMTKHSRVSFDGPLKHEGWRQIKSYYMHTKNDMIVPPELQMKMIEKAKEQGADVEVVVTDAGHVPMLGREKEVAELLVRAAGL